MTQVSPPVYYPDPALKRYLVSVAKCVLGLNLRRIAKKYSSKTEPILCRSRYFLEKTGCGTSKSSRSTSDAKSV